MLPTDSTHGQDSPHKGRYCPYGKHRFEPAAGDTRTWGSLNICPDCMPAYFTEYYGHSYDDDAAERIAEYRQHQNSPPSKERKAAQIAALRTQRAEARRRNQAQYDAEISRRASRAAHRAKRAISKQHRQIDRVLGPSARRQIRERMGICEHGRGCMDTAFQLLVAQPKARCVHPECRKKRKQSKLTKDHIIPLAAGGLSCRHNLQLLCQSHNSSKKDKLINAYETGRLI